MKLRLCRVRYSGCEILVLSEERKIWKICGQVPGCKAYFIGFDRVDVLVSRCLVILSERASR